MACGIGLFIDLANPEIDFLIRFQTVAGEARADDIEAIQTFGTQRLARSIV